MDSPSALVADLHQLTQVLDLPEIDIAQALDALRADIATAVPSFVGLSMTLVVEGQGVTLTSMNEDADSADITSSLRLGVAARPCLGPGSALLLFATTPGAFVDLAADLSYALGADAGGVRFDEHLNPPVRQSGLRGVEELSIVNRALGLLIGQGYTPPEARSWMEHKAASTQMAMFQVAAYLISSSE